ncbi:MAG: MATE family efflux transporter [Rhodospirillales bacterium]|nr:MATE family efflux transporter [Rhodospirillales bacterium]MDE0379119.1 MATE family efflux transporter [Rhodospirillales bacterium]
MRRSPLIREWAWHRRVWRLAWPMVVSNLSVPLLGAVDTAVIGHLPEPHFLGAIAVGALIFNTLYFGCNFLRMGTTGLTAQAFGAHDFDAARATLLRALLIALVLALALLALQGPIGWLAFYLVEPSEAVAGEGMRYYFIRIWGAPAALANVALVGWFIGMQNTRAALALLLTVNGINIVLDLVLVLGFGLAVAGAAWATVAADYSGLILGMAVTTRLANRHGGHWRPRLVLDAVAMRRFLGINRDIFLRTLFVITAFALFTTLSARQGDVVLAANAVLLNFVIFFNFAFDGFAFAAEALTGRALGARRREDLARAVRACLLWCLALAVLTLAVYGLAGAPIVRVLTDLGDVRAVAYDHLPWLIALPVVAVWGIFFDGVFTGVTRTAHMRNNMMLAFAVFVPCAWLLREPLGNHGLWLAMTLLYAVRGIGLGTIFVRIQRRGGFLPALTPRDS